MTVDAILASPIGPLGLTLSEGSLSALSFLPASQTPSLSLEKPFQVIAAEISAYFKNPGHRFNLPLKPQGTPFQLRVWQALLAIPAGETRSYQELAQELKTSPRALGNACRKNPLPLLIPCHRVLAKSGLGGYCGAITGEFIKIKQFLLQHEACA
jgi:methylated-DNA-[protein]-cysteine S-methyltransferase